MHGLSLSPNCLVVQGLASYLVADGRICRRSLTIIHPQLLASMHTCSKAIRQLKPAVVALPVLGSVVCQKSVHTCCSDTLPPAREAT